MKYRAIAGAALLGSAFAAKEELTFAVMRFNGEEIFTGRVDPIVNPGVVSPHEHTVFGGSNFAADATGESLSKSKCTSAKVKGDNSAYWMPRLYYHDESAGSFEPVPVLYSNVYYFFDASDDDIVAFPKGLSILSGDTDRRDPPKNPGVQNLDTNNGPINNVFWTCRQRDGNPKPYPEDSDGTSAGIAAGAGQGVGFPFSSCDLVASPLRADVHFPSCYNPEAGLTNWKENMAFPSSEGASVSGRTNCPEGYIHVPRLLFEIYWDTQQFNDRWTPDGTSQPFVLSNGDVTGYSLHADFLAAWDEDVLQHIIDTCHVEHASMDTCPGVTANLVSDCKCDGEVSAFRSAHKDSTITELPGKNPLSGWKYGAYVAQHEDNVPAANFQVDKAAGNAIEDVVEEVVKEEEDEQEDVSYPEEEPTDFPVPTEKPALCVTRTHTVVETVTVWEDAAPTDLAKAKRHLHRHQARAHRN